MVSSVSYSQTSLNREGYTLPSNPWKTIPNLEQDIAKSAWIYFSFVNEKQVNNKIIFVVPITLAQIFKLIFITALILDLLI